MTNTQKLTIRASEIRQRLNAISTLDGDAITEQVQAEEIKLQTEYRETETKLRAAIASDPEPVATFSAGTAEGRELRMLTARADLGAIFQAALDRGTPQGETRELQEHHGLGPNQIPLDMLRQADRRQEFAVTPAPGNVGTDQGEVVPYVFPQACAAFLGIDSPAVGVGEAVFPVLTKKLTVRTPTENNDADETTGAFAAEVLSPSRIQASFFYSREDRARFAGMDQALRMNLGEGLADGLDDQILSGTNGLFTGTNLADNARGTGSDFAHYRDALGYGRVDGRYAGGVGDLRLVVGQATYAKMATVYRANNADDSALDVLMAKTGGVKVSPHVPAVASSKQNAVVRLGSRRDMVAPVWDGVTLIPDEVTKAKAGQIVITAVMLHAVKIVRAGGFHKQETNHS